MKRSQFAILEQNRELRSPLRLSHSRIFIILATQEYFHAKTDGYLLDKSYHLKILGFSIFEGDDEV